MLEIRKLEVLEDFKEIVTIQKDAWGLADQDLEPHHLMTRIQKYGGLVLGLFLDRELIGFSLALIGKIEGEFIIYSHMAAILKDFQGRGYGYLLKKAQREEVLKMGYEKIYWCFDPLESQNSFFNLHRLGVVCCEYERDVYGVGHAGLHCGLPTDRLVALWDLKSPRVKEKVAVKVPCQSEPVIPGHVGNFNRETTYIEIPRDIRRLKKSDLEKARKWRQETRRLFEEAFERGFIAEEMVFSKDKEKLFFKLFRRR